MRPPERVEEGERPPGSPRGAGYELEIPRYGRWVGLLVILILVLITINTVLTKPNGVAGVPPGERVPPFAVPLALSKLEGAADVARHAHEGAAGSHAACTLRGAEILNICELYERGPVVLALFVNGGSCPRILSEMQRLLSVFPGVSFAAVEMRGERSALRRLVRSLRLSLPVGFDREGTLAPLYRVVGCPQVNFIYPGGVVQSWALLRAPSLDLLRSRVGALLAATKLRRARRVG